MSEAMLYELYNAVNPELVKMLLQYIKENNRKMIDQKFIICEPIINYYGEYRGSYCFTIVEKKEEDVENDILVKKEERKDLIKEYYIRIAPFDKISLVVTIEKWR